MKHRGTSMTTLPAPNCALGALTWLDECTSQDYSDENMQRRPEEVDEVAAFIRVWFERYPKESCQCNMRKPKWKHWEKRKRAHDYAAPRDEHSRGTVAPTPQVSRPSNVLQLLDPGVPPRLVDLSSGDVDAVCQTIRGNVSGLVQDIIYTMINGGILTIQLIDICLIDLLAARLADPTARHQPIQAPEFSENISMSLSVQKAHER